MELETLEKLLLWSMVVNTGIYVVTAIASYLMRDFLYKVHAKLFNMEREAVDRATQNYLSNYKLLITVFNFAPWVALLIIN